jgi:hypothetical protein
MAKDLRGPGAPQATVDQHVHAADDLERKLHALLDEKDRPAGVC